MKIGFTGSSRRVTAEQRRELPQVLALLAREGNYYTDFHHGDCIEADEAAHVVAYQLGFKIIIHPPEDARKRAWCKSKYGHPAAEHMPPAPYIERNHDIVDATEVLVAMPDSAERLRSGTWATVRYAQKKGRRIITIWPDGEVEDSVDG